MATPSTTISTGLMARTCIVALGIGYNFALIGPIAFSLRDRFGVDFAAIGLLTTAMLVTHAASQLPSAVPASRYGPLRMVRWAFVLVAAANVLSLVSPAFWVLLLSRVLVGIGTGPIFVGALDGSRRLGGPLLAGVFGGAATIGIGLSIAVGAILDGAGAPWQSTFAVAAGLAILAILFGPRDAPDPDRGVVKPPTGFREVFRSGGLWRLVALHSATFGASLIVAAWIVPHLDENGASIFLAGLIGFLLLVANGIGRFAGGALAARGVGWLWLGPGATLFAAMGLILLAPAAGPVVAFVAGMLVGVGFAFPFSVVFVRAVHVEPRFPAAAIAFVNMAGAVFALLVTPLGGVLLDRGAGWAIFALLAAFAVFAALLNRRAPRGDGV
jgi:predicted MFS family arabinose efflux permease